MERIQEAIEKARAERQGNIGQTASSEQLTQLREKPQGKVGVLDIRPVDVAYTQTRRIKIEDESLRVHRVVAAFNFNKHSEVYRQLRTKVLKALRDNNWKTLAITSTHEGAGKTLTAVNLAISLAREVNHTVMLVDLDLRTPSLHKTLGFHVEKGLVEYLHSGDALENYLVNPGVARLVILPGTESEEHHSEILSSPEMKSLISDICNRYHDRLIIFDLPPLLRNDDAMIFTPSVDTTLLVVEDGVTSEDDLKHAMHLLKGQNILGTVLNKAR